MIEQILLIAVAFGIINVLVVYQAFALSRIFQSRAWFLLAAGFIAIGIRQMWILVKLPSGLIQALGEHKIPESLTLSEWGLLLIAFVAFVLWALGLRRLRNDLQKIGAAPL